ncbi:MAG: acetyl-CoA acetyltransferase [Euryarchaeota archaeon RBG_19FT_COMBO_56_21]|nr:MAG: acetyl-CoA acetyltransferase [Euryarchaeota archaeon RBG_19FT_COMBO_56_21]
MKEAVIVSATRTPIGKFGGALKDLSAPKLGSIAVREAVLRAKVSPKEVEECIMGNVLAAGLGQNPARQAALHGGLTEEVAALTVNKVCGSGLKAVMLASDAILAGKERIIVAGGMESMSNAPYLLEKARFGYKMFDSQIIDSMVRDGLWDVFNNFHMGNTGEICAQRNAITRQDADKFSLWSQQKAVQAIKSGAFKDEIVQVEIESKKEKIVVSVDEGPREDSTLEGLAKLKPVFKNDGVLTAGNSSTINDGASATVVMDSELAKEKGLKPLVRIVDYLTVGVRPELLMEAPIHATKKLLNRNNLQMGDIDLIEHNEAFSTASIATMRSLVIPESRFNVNGGAVALGHPIGCSGARVLTTLIYAMKAREAKRGIATLCLGGGNAVAMLVEQ